ncbi:MAG TPA: hypothetical protein VJX74_04690, partial [Blastocatellia bacterium]|nr:hypothetical protein [Blastocatellia bacterium]
MNNVFRKSRPSEAIKVFYSYAHEDEVLKDKLVKHLKIYERLGIIRAWHDRKIIPGQEWSSEINT